MTDSSSVIVVGASEDEFDHVKQCLSDWQCVPAPLNDEETEVFSIPAAADAFIVYARKEQEKTQAICERLRSSAECSTTPILLAINRYEITQGSAVKRMGNATFIITPFKEEELREKIEQMKKESENHGSGGN